MAEVQRRIEMRDYLGFHDAERVAVCVERDPRVMVGNPCARPKLRYSAPACSANVVLAISTTTSSSASTPSGPLALRSR